jgi:DNA-binding Lrp family transcriptional regulator
LQWATRTDLEGVQGGWRLSAAAVATVAPGFRSGAPVGALWPAQRVEWSMRVRQVSRDFGILIRAEVGQAAVVAAALRDVPGVSEAVCVTGPYDVIARAEARNIDELGRLVVSRVQALSGVARTMTCPVVHL